MNDFFYYYLMTVFIAMIKTVCFSVCNILAASMARATYPMNASVRKDGEVISAVKVIYPPRFIGRERDC